MPNPTKKQWLKVADRYWELWNLPNCVGAIDGKHIKIKAPPNSGSSFYNYKGYFSIVLMAVSDADGLFLSVDIGEYGRNSDGRALKESEFGKALFNDQLSLPEPTYLPGEEDIFPYYFVADEAFPLTDHIMRPYPRRQLTNERRIYNYRISRGRKSVECAFGMMVSKFRLLETPIHCGVNNIDCIVQAVCVLHNFIGIHDGSFTQSDKPQIQSCYQEQLNQNQSKLNNQRPTNNAVNLRNRLCNFFSIHPLPWQEKYTV